MNNKKHRIRVVALFLVFTMIFTIGSGFYNQNISLAADDDPLSAWQAQQSVIQNNLDQLKDEVNSSKDTLSAYQQQLRTVDAEIEAAEKQLEALETQLANANRILEVIDGELEKSQESLSNQLDAFGTRLREYYMTGELSMLDVFFESSSMEEFITLSYYMEQLVAYDTEMIETINTRIEEIQTKRTEQAEMVADIQTMTSEQEAIKAALDEKRSQKLAMVADAQDEYDEALDTYDEMLQTAQEVEQKIKDILAQQGGGSSGTTGSGIFMWPLPSQYKTVSSNYGMRWHPTKHVYKMHTGIDLPAPAGTPIYAADSGTVIMAQYYGSYGNCVIINHGNGTQTLYGHQSRIAVSNGASVSKGQIIGYVGTTGASTGNHLHFEVRVNGSYVSPWGYVSK